MHEPSVQFQETN